MEEQEQPSSLKEKLITDLTNSVFHTGAVTGEVMFTHFQVFWTNPHDDTPVLLTPFRYHRLGLQQITIYHH